MRRTAISLLFGSAISLVCLMAAAPAPRAQAPGKPNPTVITPLVLYDDFNGQRIDPAKWIDASFSYDMREIVRELSPAYEGQGNNRRLRMFNRAYSETSNDSGGTYGWFAVQFAHPASILEVSFTVAVNTAAIADCQSNPSFNSCTWAGFTGRFFNYGGYTDPNQDVSADITLHRDVSNPPGTLLAYASVNSGDRIVSDSRLLGSVFLGQTAKLRVKWDQANRQFIFQLDNDPAVSIGYSVADTFPPFYAVKELWSGKACRNAQAHRWAVRRSMPILTTRT